MSSWRHATKPILWLCLLMPIVLYGAILGRRPQPSNLGRQPLFQGITYSQRTGHQPRPYIAHIVEIDLATPGVRPFVTPLYSGLELSKRGFYKFYKNRARRTSAFLDAHDLQLAVNANFFLPFHDATPWHFKPRSGQEVNVVGLAIADGEVVSPVNANKQPPPPALCFTEQRAAISRRGTCAEGTQYAVAGNLLLLEKGQTTDWLQQQGGAEANRPYSFTLAAVDASGRRLWLIVVDGKQPFYSEGLTLEEVAALIQELGADAAVRLDGGGSTTLVVESSSGATFLNTPIHGKVPGQERPVATHLGFYAPPVKPGGSAQK